MTGPATEVHADLQEALRRILSIIRRIDARLDRAPAGAGRRTA